MHANGRSVLSCLTFLCIVASSEIAGTRPAAAIDQECVARCGMDKNQCIQGGRGDYVWGVRCKRDFERCKSKCRR
jgi:hypothetical protein